jgi:Outer membrane protein beta-barrel domain
MTMLRKTILTAMAFGLVAVTARAQDHRVELSGTAGWTFSDGVNVGAIDDSPIRVDPKDAFSWGARLGFNLNENAEVGFLFNLQSTDLEASGIVNRSVPQTIYNYHGYFAYNFGDPDAKARPYVLGGLGATQYGSLSTAAGDVGGETQFSSTWALGLKVFPNPKFGLRLEARWTPTYIKSDPEGYWCDPYWGCYTVSEAEFSNQYELSGGIIIRF